MFVKENPDRKKYIYIYIYIYTEEKGKQTGATSPIQQRWKLLSNVIIESLKINNHKQEETDRRNIMYIYRTLFFTIKLLQNQNKV